MPELTFIEQEKMGITMEEVTVQSVHDALLELYETPLEERKAMGCRGREYVTRHHSWSAVVSELVGEET
jgi:glycosyltransferase involved in cell wall biosynthesis